MYQISELSNDGRKFIKTFDPRSVKLTWIPAHLAFYDDGQLFVSDWSRDRVYLLSSQLTDPRILLNRFRHHLIRPQRLCYVREKQKLIVGQTKQIGEPGVISVLSICKQGRSFEKSFQMT